MNWIITPFTVILAATSGISLVTGILAWNRRGAPGSRNLAFLMFAAAEWAFASALESASILLESKIFWSKVEYIGSNLIAPLLVLFVLDYTHRRYRLHGWRSLVLFILPVAAFLLTATNELHNLVWTNFTPSPIPESNLWVYHHGIGYWAYIAYINIYIAYAVVLLIKHLLQLAPGSRKQTISILVACFFPWIGNIIYSAGIPSLAGLDLVPITFSFTGIVMVLSILRFRLFDIIPVARDAIVEHMSDGMVMLDTQSRIVDMNPMARRFLQIDNIPYGQTVEEALPYLTRVHPVFHASHYGKVEMEGLQYLGQIMELDSRPLTNRSGKNIGQLVTIRDITEQKKEERALEETRAILNAGFAQSPIPMVLVSAPEGIIQIANQASRDFLGIGDEPSYIGTKISQLRRSWLDLDANGNPVDWNDLPITRALRGEKTLNQESCIRTQFGEERWSLASAVPIFNNRDEIIAAYMVFPDITQQREAEKALRKSEERHRMLAENTRDVIWTMDLNSRFTYVSPSVFTLRGYTAEEVMQQSLFETLTGESARIVLHGLDQDISNVIDGKKFVGGKFELEQRCKDGSSIWTEVTIDGMYGDDGKFVGIQGVTRDISERKKAEEELRQANSILTQKLEEIQELQDRLQEQVIRDPLTGLFNRRYLEETLDRELQRARRGNYPVSAIMIDLDHFKQFNDRYGHFAGDLVLQALGKLLLQMVRRSDIPCRYGGEEFLIIMPNSALEICTQRAEEMRAEFERMNAENEDPDRRTTFSAGAAVFPIHGESAEEIICAADAAMYAAKLAGRNRVTASIGK